MIWLDFSYLLKQLRDDGARSGGSKFLLLLNCDEKERRKRAGCRAMKCYKLYAVGDLRYEDAGLPALSEDWCLIQVRAAGICSSDVPRVFRNGMYHYPTIPGHEFSGVVVDARGANNDCWIGKRVGVFPLIPCRKCQSCQVGAYQLCTDYDYLGSRRDGGFSEYCAVPAWNLVELPSSIAYENGAMLEPISVACHAVRKFSAIKNRTMAIVGTGAIGLIASQWAVANGADRVVVVGRNDAKRSIVDHLCNVEYAAEDDCSQLQGSFDNVLEAVGSSDSIASSLSLAKGGGEVVLMGNPEGDISIKKNAYWQVLRKELIVKGTWNSGYAQGFDCDWTESIDALSKGSINCDSIITHRVAHNELDRALCMMRDHSEPYCKVMTIWGNDNA